MKIEKIKLAEIVNDKLTNKDLVLLTGGSDVNGCGHGVCSSNLADNTDKCTNGDGVCKSSIVV